jgi:transcriptional regulator with XRE-family HTH domain
LNVRYNQYGQIDHMTIQWARVGPGIRDRRKALKLTQAELAKAAGVQWNAIAKVEVGLRRPSIDLLEAIADVLDCRVADLLPESGPRRRRTRRKG